MSKRVENNLEFGLWADRNGYIATARRDIALHEDGEYLLTFCVGGNDAFDVKQSKTLAELETAMRKVQPDLRKWRLNRP